MWKSDDAYSLGLTFARTLCLLHSFIFLPMPQNIKKTYAFILMSTNIVHLITVYIKAKQNLIILPNSILSHESDTKLTNSGHHHSVHNRLEQLSDKHVTVLKVGKRGEGITGSCLLSQ